MTARSLRHRAALGFTLVELIATMVILAAIGTVAGSTVINSVKAYADASTAAQLQTETSAAMERVVRALQAIELDSSYAGIAPRISAVTANSIAWTNSAGQAFSLSVSSNQLRYVEAGAAAVVLLGDVSALGVQTYNESNAALSATLSGTACRPIRRVQITLTTQRAARTQTLRTKVFLRCTMAGAEGGT